MASPVLDSDELSTIELKGKGCHHSAEPSPSNVNGRTKHHTSRSSSFHVRVGLPLSRTWRRYIHIVPARSVSASHAAGGIGRRDEPIDDPTATAAGIWPIPEVGPYVVDGPVLPSETLPTGTRATVPEEAVERALVFAARELQQVVGRHVDVPVDGLDDAGERIAELGVVWKRKAFSQQGRGEWRCGHRMMRVERGHGWC